MKIVFALLISVLPSLLLGVEQPSIITGSDQTDWKIQLTDQERDWLKEHPVIRVSNEPDYPPFDFHNNGEPAGYSIDYVRLLAQRLGIRLEFVQDNWSNLLKKAEKKEVDLVHTIFDFPEERKNYLEFTHPYKRVINTIVMRDDVVSVNDLSDLNGLRVALVTGDSIEKLLKENVPEMQDLYFDNYSEALKAIAMAEADAMVLELPVANYLILKLSLTNLKIVGEIEVPAREVAYRLAVRKDWPIFAQILNKAIENLSPEEVLQLDVRWEALPKPGRQHQIILTTEEKAWLESNSVIELHTADDAPPYEYVDQSGHVQGILNDYAKALERRLGIRLQLIPHGGKEYFDLIKQGSAHLIGIDAFRTDQTPGYLHSKRAVQAHFSLFAKGIEPVAVEIESLEGATIGVISGLWHGMEFIEQLKKKNRIVEMDTTAEFVNGLLSGQLDYGFEAQGVILSYLSSTQIKDINVVYTLPTPIDGGFMVNKNSPLLLSVLNKAIADIDPNELSAILSKWYDNSIHMPMSLSEEEKAWLKEHPVIRVAIDPHWAPVEFKDKAGKFQGISADYLSLLETNLGVRFEPEMNLSWQELVKAVKNKELDMFASVSRTPERETFSLFTQPYVSMPIRIFSHKDMSYIGSLVNLAGKKVAIVKDYAIEEWLRNDHPELELISASSPGEGLMLVLNGEADVFVGNVVTATYYINKLGLDDIRTAGDTSYANNQTMAVRDDWPILAGILKKSLKAIPSQQHEAIFNRWMSLRFEHTIDYQLLWQVVFVALVLIIAILYWTRRLKVEVSQRIHAETELRNYQSTLEQQVEVRTAKLKTSETLVRKILESTGSGVFGMDHNGIQTFANEAGAKILGYSKEELIGQPSHETWHHHHTDGTSYQDEDCPIKETLVNGRKSSGEEWLVRKNGSFVPVEFTSSPIIEDDAITGAVISFMDLSERHHLDSIKKSILKGTSSMVGEAFMYELVENLAQTLDMRYAFIGEADPELKSIRTLAVWANGERGENFSYELAHTPCENVVGQNMCSYPSGIQERFPEDKLLVAMDAESYAGEPLFDSNGTPLGILSVLDDKPLKDESLVRSIVTLFAGRAGAELERVIAHRKLEISLEQTVRAIAHTVEQRDPYTSGHQNRVAKLAVAIAEEMGLKSDQVKSIYIGSTMHDIGNIYVPTDILHRPGQLTDVEFSIIKSHTTVGYEIIKDVEFPWPVSKMLLQHHERLDGSGYPNGLEDGEIILEARILAVADVVEAINSHRPYRPSLGIESALDEITKHRGVLYDPEVVDACLRLFKEDLFSWPDKSG